MRSSGWGRLWRALTGRIAPSRGPAIVLDRRQGERRQRVQPVAQERRRVDRRHPTLFDFSDVRTFLGEGSRLKGDLRFEGAVRLDGRFTGEAVRGDVLIIGPRAQVVAAIEGRFIRIHGQVHGPITARQQVELREASRVTGTIRTPRLLIWEGACFTGRYEPTGSVGA